MQKNDIHQVRSVQVYRAGLHPQPFAPLTPSDGDRLAVHQAHEYNEHDDLWMQHRASIPIYCFFLAVTMERRGHFARE